MAYLVEGDVWHLCNQILTRRIIVHLVEELKGRGERSNILVTWILGSGDPDGIQYEDPWNAIELDSQGN